MSNIDTYEQNLERRLAELRNGDPAYELHKLAITEAIIFSHDQHGYTHTPRILDCGCGLGFLTASLAKGDVMKIEGIDPSKRSIELAKEEHSDVSFWHSSAESFPQIMKDNNIELYDQAILNMVLHSVDDESVKRILGALQSCIRPEGAVIITVPEQGWIIQKLVEYAQDQGMDKKTGLRWIEEQFFQDKITIPVKIRGGEYYPEPLTLYNRTIDDYGGILRSQGYGVPLDTYSGETREKISSKIIPYWIIDDYFAGAELSLVKDRELLISFALQE